MNDIYVNQAQRQTSAEKIKYALHLEQKEEANLGHNTQHYSPNSMNHRQPLGKIVTQVEMTNADARN